MAEKRRNQAARSPPPPRRGRSYHGGTAPIIGITMDNQDNSAASRRYESAIA
ncbi:MAG: hypothetical protein ACLFV3_10020 [Phycisphaeraceae bacterium]